MYGWRAKIGLITPVGESAEHAFHIYAPEGVSFSSTKLSLPALTPEGFAGLADQLEETAGKYRGYDLDLVVFGCAAGSCIKGSAWNQACTDRMERACGIPGLTTGTAVLEGLQKLGARKVAVLTPYPEAIYDAEKRFLEENGFEVTNIVSMDMRQFKDRGLRIEAADEHFLYQHSVRVDLKGADAFYLSSMELAAMEIIDLLETALEIPVVTSHQVTLWGALRHCRVGAKIPKMGRLFTL